MQKKAGKNFPLNKNEEILKINSPQSRVRGPWVVVHKNIDNRWAIVLLHWDGNPCLGIRWFYGRQGTPSIGPYATWLIIPNELTDSILDKLPITPQMRNKINRVLLGEHSIDNLKNENF